MSPTSLQKAQTSLDALIERVRGLTGADREVDAEIDVALFGGETVWLTTKYTMEQYPASRRPSKSHVGGFAKEHVPLVTASVDAAMALAEKVKPGWFWHILPSAVRACYDADGKPEDLARFIVAEILILTALQSEGR